ncbi:MAG: S8 family peptidase [Chloroflexi bacterium]|nr:S8 family peptidase [Chloroflexota bacterium]
MEAPENKIVNGLWRSIESAPNSDSQISVILRYRSTQRVMRYTEYMPGVHFGRRYRLGPYSQLEATPAAIRTLAASPDVVRIYQDVAMRVFLDSSVPHIHVPYVWEQALTGKGIKIAVVDTGIDQSHPDFQGRILNTYDITGETVQDGCGHGTHCASIAAGSGAASKSKYRGVAPEASLLIAKVLRNDGSGMMSDVMDGVEWAVDQGAQVISLSLGEAGSSDGNDPLCDLCEAAVQRGVVVVAAAGNEGPMGYSVGSPAAAPNIITIGAASDLDRIAEFSSRGPTADGRVKPDVVLPGVDIIAARAQGTSMGMPLDAYYTSASGTSMATPHAAGLCALILQADSKLKPADIKKIMMDTARDLGYGPNAQGVGLADAWAAVKGLIGNPQPTPIPEPEPTPSPDPSPIAKIGCLPGLLKMLIK